MIASQVYLVLLETTGNQRHIFETNKLAENVGASQQILEVGLDSVLEAVRDAGLKDLKEAPDVLERAKNPRIEDDEQNEVEVWYVSSGKAMLLVRNRDVGKAIVRHVTQQAIGEYPGVTVRGAISQAAFSLDSVESLASAVKSIHEQLESSRSLLPPAELRFQRWMFITPTSNISCGWEEESRLALAVSPCPLRGQNFGAVLTGKLITAGLMNLPPCSRRPMLQRH